jgi:hypothetical protein
MLLSGSEIIHNVPKVSINLVVMLQVFVHLICLLLESSDLHFPGRDISLQLLDLIVEHELELFELLSLLLELIDLFLLISDRVILILNLGCVPSNFLSQLGSCVGLSVQLLILVLDFSLELLDVRVQILELVPRKLELSLGLETHVTYLGLILLVLGVNILDFKLGIILDLLDNLTIVFLHPLDFSSELLCLGDLTFHEGPVLVHDLIHIPIVLVDDLIDLVFEGSCILLLLSLELLELGCILEHLLRVLVPLLFKLDLVLLCKLLDPLLEGILHFPLVFIQGVIPVLGLHLRVGELLL